MFARSDRLKELFRTEISRVLLGVKDPGLSGFLTLTDLQLSADGKKVSVYYSVMGTQREKNSTSEALERAAPYIRQVLRKRLTLKVMPHFIFIYDDTPRRASRIDHLLMRLKEEEGRRP